MKNVFTYQHMLLLGDLEKQVDLDSCNSLVHDNILTIAIIYPFLF